jgi:AcrR family transcriptional regulator
MRLWSSGMTNSALGEAEGVRAKQRERLLNATIDVVSDIGYDATRVADLLEASGVSRNAFYKLFDSKHDCFLATIDRLVEMSGPSVLDVYDRTPGSWYERMLAMLDALATTIVAYPAMARVGWIEVYAAGPEAVARVERIDERVEKMVRAALAESPERSAMPLEVVRAVIGGLRKVIHSRLREGREGELPGLMPEMLEWMMSYQTPAERLRRPRKPPAGLIPDVPPPADSRERILAALTDLVAEQGYPSVAITEIAARASVSLSTFYALFEGKEEAFVAAIDRGWERTIGAVLPAYGAASDWPLAVSAGLHAFCAIFTVEPALGRLGGIGTYEGGPAGLERRDQSILAAQALLHEGYRRRPDVPAITAEAVGATIYALVSRQVRRRGAERLYEVAPAAAFIALAPFVGSDEAARVANERVAAEGGRSSDAAVRSTAPA